jgi:hypothetical protein
MNGKMCLPSLYHKLYQAESSRTVNSALRKHIEPLMKNELIFECDSKVGKRYEEWFLSFTIKDEDLPWDITETDW